MSFIPLLRGEEVQDDRPLNERSLEQSCCFVLLDGDGAFADEAGRRFINYLLQTCRTPQPDAASRRIRTHPLCGSGYAAAVESPPGRFLAGSQRRLTCVSRLLSAPFSNRNWWSLPEQFAGLLERWHIRAEIRIDAFDHFNNQLRPPADIWLSNFMLDTLSVPAFLEWLASTALFTRLPESQRQKPERAVTDDSKQRR
ncbi:putative dipeptide/oligopeptide/nickel ABC-type transport system periplasmic component [Salmonella sp. NCTC 11881]|nr:putative dipeptide/oligopeptide/nickel ABC-type transport system periplasmic component [Salmonella sp. NCTC 11881]